MDRIRSIREKQHQQKEMLSGQSRKANIRRMTGRSKDEPVDTVVADTVTTKDGTEYFIYKVY